MMVTGDEEIQETRKLDERTIEPSFGDIGEAAPRRRFPKSYAIRAGSLKTKELSSGLP